MGTGLDQCCRITLAGRDREVELEEGGELAKPGHPGDTGRLVRSQQLGQRANNDRQQDGDSDRLRTGVNRWQQPDLMFDPAEEQFESPASAIE